MVTSSHAKADAAVKRLRAWLSAGNTIPRRHGRVNKTALCNAVGITRSTLDSNPRLRALVASLDELNPSRPRREPTPEASSLECEITALREENAALKRKLRSVTLLLTTGRCLHP
jgi:hypothetical protein